MHAREHASDTAQSTTARAAARPSAARVTAVRAPRRDTAVPAGPVPQATRGAPPPARDLRALQRGAGNAAVSRMISRSPAGPGAGRAAVQEVLRSPGTPLDAGLRADMESRLGADFGDVRVHTGGAAQRSAADLGARAYTSGHHIVAGPGGLDRHTLAHELAHVMQQRSGPVTGTDRGDGLRVSDPGDRFERAAEATARRVLAGPAPARPAEEPGAAGPTRWQEAGVGHVRRQETAAGPMQRQEAVDAQAAPVQRSVEWYARQDETLTAFGTALGTLVEDAAAAILARPELVDVPNNGYVARWHRVFATFVESERTNTAFLYTAFGYAVEALTNARLDEVRNRLPAGWTVSTQVTHGHTRPDLVVFDDQYREQAWFDITARDSRGHIRDKTGAGWGTRPYVAEVVYPSLRPGDLVPSTVSDEQRAQFAAAAAEELRREEQILDQLQQWALVVHGAMLADIEVGSDRAKQRRFFEDEMYLQIGAAAAGAMRAGASKLSPATAKSVLAHLQTKGRRTEQGDPWLSAFGYTRDQATGRDPVTFGRIVNELAVRNAAAGAAAGDAGAGDAMDIEVAA